MGIFSRIFGKKAQPQESVKEEAPPVAYTPPAPEQPAPKQPEPEGKKYKVAGVTHYEDNIMALASENDDYHLSKRGLIDEGLVEERVWEYEFYPIKAELVPEPDNPHDPKAIKVLVDGLHVGYIKAGSCAHLLKAINEDRIKKIDVKMGGGRYKYLEIIDYKENGDEIYELDRDNVPLYVHLNIAEAK